MEFNKQELTKYRHQGHNVVIEGKRHLVISGVIDVESFRDEEAVVLTQVGALSIFGEGLHLSRLNPEDGQVIIDGDLIALEYEPPETEKKGLFSKLKK